MERFAGIYDEDSKLPANLRKAHKLNYRVLHPGNNKQCVNSALAVFDETTVVAIRPYLPERKDMAGFLTLILKWWTIVNSRKRFTSNKLANDIILGYWKNNFLKPRKLQSDTLENRFSQYRQMSGGRFLVSLYEVKNS